MAIIESNWFFNRWEKRGLEGRTRPRACSPSAAESEQELGGVSVFLPFPCGLPKVASSRNRIMMPQGNFGMFTDLWISESVFRCTFQSLSLQAIPCVFPSVTGNSSGFDTLGLFLVPVGSCPGLLLERGTVLCSLVPAPSPSHGKSQRVPSETVQRTPALALGSHSGRF